jgi:hypothetical protein
MIPYGGQDRNRETGKSRDNQWTGEDREKDEGGGQGEV